MVDSLLQSRYRLDAELGQGGMGIVYRAHDTLLDRAVAVKLLTDAGLGAEGRARLLREARAAARLNHPNIVGVYDAGEAENQPFIVMELVEGESLYAQWPIPLENVVGLAEQICAALDHAHTHGIVHRDLKLENILLTPDGVIKLTDFGLARSVASRLTSEGLMLGTVFYLAPELALGQPFDGRADLYALGVLLYELVTGKLPFTADEPLAVVSQHLYAPVVPPRAHNDNISDGLNQLIVSLLGKRPEDRPASAREVLSALASIRDKVTGGQGEMGLEHTTLSPSNAEHSRHPVTPELNILDRIVRGRLVGREREMAEASVFWKQALNGQSHVLLISGEPGIGKSRLVRELAALAEMSRAIVLKAECYAEGSAPYAPIAQMIRGPLQNPAWAGLETLGLPDYVLTDLMMLSPDLRARYAKRHLPPNPQLDPQSEQYRLFESVTVATAALTERAPVLLVLEDAHWADSGTLFLLRHLARRLHGRRLLMVLTYREVEIDEACCLPDVLHDLNRERLATRIKLTRLTREQTQKLLEVMFGEDISPELLEGLYRETEGNPFFIEEVCKALLEDGQIYFADGRWQRPAVSELHIPQSIRVTIHARLGKLPTPAQEALRLAAVLGREFDFDTLHTASGLNEEALIEALESAARAQIIEEAHANGHGLTFAFAHALIPSTLRESMSGPRLRVLHRRAAAAVEQLRPEDFEVLAYHAGQAGDDERAGRFYQRAGERALSRYANQEAERHYRTALDLSEGAEPRAKRYAGLGEALFRLSRYAEAEQSWREAIALHQLLSEYTEAARLYGRAVRAVWYQEDAPRSLALAREGLAALAGRPETPGLAALLHEMGRACFFNEQMEEARTYCQQALTLAEQFGLVEVQAESLTTLGLLPNQTPDDMQIAFERAIALAETHQLWATAARAHFNLAGNIYEHSEPRRARDHYERARQHAQQMRMAAWELDYTIQIVGTSLSLGELERAQTELEYFRELQKTAPPQAWAVYLRHLNEAVLTYFYGHAPEALAMLRASKAELLAQSGLQVREQKFIHEFNSVLIQTLIYEKQYGEIENLVSESLALVEQGVEANHVFFNATKCITLAWQGRWAEAQHALTQAEEPLPAQHSSPGKIRFQQILVLWAKTHMALADKRWTEALTLFEASDKVFCQLGWRWYAARTKIEWAQTHLARRELGDQEQASALLTGAIAEFEAMRIPYFATQARQLLSTISSTTQAPAPISGD